MFNPVHPGEMLKEDIIVPLGLNMEKTAKHLGISRKHLSSICNCKNAITATLSIRLEQAFGAPSAETWVKMQAKYDVWVAQQADTHPIERIQVA